MSIRSLPLCALLTGALLTAGLTPAPAPAAAAGDTRVSAVSQLVPSAVQTRRKPAKKRPHAKPAAPPRPAGYPRRSWAIPAGAYFSYPNRSRAESLAIRQRVLTTIDSVWGGARDPRAAGLPVPGSGSIRLATWSFQDPGIARALVRAHARGVSVQVVAAAGKNKRSKPWRYLRKKLKARPFPAGHPELADRSSFARICRGSCRGPGGTAHAKYFLFDNVGLPHLRHITVSTSMNLTEFAYENQWNQAAAWHDRGIYADFLGVFRQARAQVKGLNHERAFKAVRNYFFPNPRMTPAQDPVVRLLGPVSCTGATPGAGTARGRTKIRVIQYATYGDRGVWIAKRLRQLWNAGCNVAIIYSLASRPVMQILRSRAGRGPIPMKQSVIRNYRGDFVKYNHSKWMTIAGHWGSRPNVYATLAGSSNWARLAATSDEQMQTIFSWGWTHAFNAAFSKTWRQRSSRKPPRISGRMLVAGRSAPGHPEDVPPFGQGIYRYMEED